MSTVVFELDLIVACSLSAPAHCQHESVKSIV
jgi:hypothetical protein